MAEIAINADLHGRVHLVVFGKDFRQHIQAGRFVGSQSQDAARGGGFIGHGAQRFAAHIDQAHGVFEQRFPGGCQPDGLSSAIEQLFAVFLLQLANLGADGRLGAEQFLARPGKTAEFRNFNKCCKLIEIHG